MERILLKGGRILCPASGLDEVGDILVQDNEVAQIGGIAGAIEGAEVIDCAGKVVTPGLIDIHVHLRDPGYEYKETVETGTAAAAAGGFTAVCCMPNTDPVNDTRAVTRQILDKAQRAGNARVYPVGAITKGLRGESLSEMAELKDAGCVGVSDDGKPVENPRMLRRAMEYADTFGLIVVCHSEDLALAKGGMMHEGPYATRLGLAGIPAAAEVVCIERDLRLAQLTGCRAHICHVSCADSLKAIARAKDEGVKVTCETAPHYLSLSDQDVGVYDTNAKMNPPLRSVADVEAMREGIKSGLIDAIATDHAPHSNLEKEVEFDLAANGVIGLETSLGIVLELVNQSVISLERAIELLNSGPARAMDLPGGKLVKGGPADITVLDLESAWQVEPDKFKSKSRNTPFAGRELKGRAILTICDGRITFRL
jgi:dihydroorotase